MSLFVFKTGCPDQLPALKMTPIPYIGLESKRNGNGYGRKEKVVVYFFWKGRTLQDNEDDEYIPVLFYNTMRKKKKSTLQLGGRFF